MSIDVDATNKESPDATGMFAEIRNLLRGLLLNQTQQRFVPYYGPDKSKYALVNEDNFPMIPLAEYSGDITAASLKYAFQLTSEDPYLDPELKRQAYTKILGAYYSIMLEDTEFELTLRNAILLLRQPGEELTQKFDGDAIKLFEFAFTGDAETRFAGSDGEGVSVDQVNLENNIIYRNILRTGKWSVSPNGTNEPLVITKDMLDDIVLSFKDGAFEYVTVPETHQDLPSQNRGFIKDVEIVEDPKRKGEYILRGGFSFTNEEAMKSALEGSIAGVSCGIVFNHQRKSDGKLYNSALHHVALTNKPWIDGLGGWEKIAASEYNAEVVVGLEDSAENPTTETTESKEPVVVPVVEQVEENVVMSDESTMKFSEEQIQAIIDENNRLKLAQSRNQVAEVLRTYQENKKLTPAVLKVAEKLLFAAEVSPKMMTLSDDDKQTEIDLAATVKEMLDAMPDGVDLSENVVSTDQTKPPTEPKTKTAAEQVAEIRELTGIKPVDAE